MVRNVRRRRKQRFYWAEIGFLILGLIGLRPSIVSEIFSMRPTMESRAPRNTNTFYDTTQPWAQPSVQQSQAFTYPTPLPGALSYTPDRPTQYQANYPTSSNAWEPARSSKVTWPDAQLHNYVHTGGTTPNSAPPYYGAPMTAYGAPMTAVAPHVASPYYGSAYAPSQNGGPPAVNGLRYQTPGTTNPPYTGRY